MTSLALLISVDAFNGLLGRRHGVLRQRALVRRSTRSCSSASSTSSDDKNSDNNNGNNNGNSMAEDPLQKALRRAEGRALDEFIENEAPSWIKDKDLQSLPFACTSCGKCCRTKGAVYLSPQELQEAATLRQLSPFDFTQQYASHTLGPLDFDETSTWIRLREEEGSCVFLDDNLQQCTIYQARPVQCRTYPFWPTILQSSTSWNDECRRNDDDTDNPLPQWTRVDGGCEGMKLLSDDTFIAGQGDELGEEERVPVLEAYHQLQQYVLSDRRFPKGTERPLTPEPY
jgi:Fe-S-cluster containining protein